ncbi:MAG: ATP-binding domain-containing protein [Phycisphaerae bacterium]
MSSNPDTNYIAELQRFVAGNKRKSHVTGIRHIQEAQHARLLLTALQAFDSPHATFYIEGLAPSGNIPRPDLILLHPDVGVLVIENKGISLEQIESIENTSIRLIRDGRLKDEDPFKQAENVMFALKDLAAKRFDLREALFLRTAAFPRIRRSELEGRFHCQFPSMTLFSDACHDPDEFRLQVLAYSDYEFKSRGKSARLTHLAHDILTDVILSGKSIFTPARRNLVHHADPSLLGAQIQELELATREATQEQKELGRSDLRGGHRLFRGVAGSGKSVMLALNAAHLLLLHRREQPSLFTPAPAQRILVTCFNRALVPYLRGKIEERFARISWDAPTDAELVVTHFEGLIKHIESQAESLRTHYTFEQRDHRATLIAERLDALPPAARNPLLFDAVYIDEAQDLLPAEFQLLRRLARTDDKNAQSLFVFYDNAQNIYGVPQPTWSDLGISITGRRTVFLDKCLRNTRQTLAFAFNVLVGSYAPEGLRVRTRQFADVPSLRQRGLVEEIGDAFEIRFAPRHGPPPRVSILPTRSDEIRAAVAEIHRLLRDEHVLPSDILILYNAHHAYKSLPDQLAAILPKGFALHQVDSAHNANKNKPLLDDSLLTLSTIASAKGYDAPVVFLLGVDALSTSDQDRARFYVAATRAKLQLYVYATRTSADSLLPEILQSAASAAHLSQSPPPTKQSPLPKFEEPSRFQDLSVQPPAASPALSCRHCGSRRLHCQQGGAGYYLLCIDCAEPTPLPRKCSKCKQTARVRRRGANFVRVCSSCSFREIVHTNLPLDSF